MALIPCLNRRDQIVELIERYNPSQKLPHLIIIDSNGDKVQDNALDLLLQAQESDSLSG